MCISRWSRENCNDIAGEKAKKQEIVNWRNWNKCVQRRSQSVFQRVSKWVSDPISTGWGTIFRTSHISTGAWHFSLFRAVLFLASSLFIVVSVSSVDFVLLSFLRASGFYLTILSPLSLIYLHVNIFPCIEKWEHGSTQIIWTLHSPSCFRTYPWG